MTALLAREDVSGFVSSFVIGFASPAGANGPQSRLHQERQDFRVPCASSVL